MQRIWRYVVLGAVSVVTVIMATGLAACGGTASLPSDYPTGLSSSPRDSPVRQTGSQLTISYTDAHGAAVTWTLTCNPVDGDHPDPEAACEALDRNAGRALPNVPVHRVCAQLIGSEQSATITGTWRGQPVNSQLDLTNSCEMDRWKAMVGLLPEPVL